MHHDNKKRKKEDGRSQFLPSFLFCVSTCCGVGVLTYLKPGENLSKGSLLLLQDVPGQSSCV